MDIADIDYKLGFHGADEQRPEPHASGRCLNGSVSLPRPATLSP
jgi:hypothetical protein